MLARRSALEHPLGAVIDLPRLVPSFTSKGFPTFEDEETGQTHSQSARALEMIGTFIRDSILVSAYDIHHGLLRQPERFYGEKELVFIDSGGYELIRDYDTTEPKELPHTPQAFTEEDYRKILSELPPNLPFVVANYDFGSKGKPLEEQILDAKSLFNDYPDLMHNFIIKPSGDDDYLCFDKIIGHIAKLRAFSMVGVTEKEIGKDLLTRLKIIAKIRLAMDRENVRAPLHVWGGLDPVLSPLYFFAGAEVFDGVSWLRYAYYNGMAVCRQSYSALGSNLGIEQPEEHVQALAALHNHAFLQRLTNALRSFVDRRGESFEMFDGTAEALERAYQTLSANIAEIRGGV